MMHYGMRRRRGYAAVAAALAFSLAAGQATAQSGPTACISSLQSEYGATDGLTLDCPSATDCSFLAPPGNASARALIGAIASKATACLTEAGMTLDSEDSQPAGVTREYRGQGEARCAVLVATPGGDSPEGVRVICRNG